ncbi:hypothetical protein [Ammoniphilus sp. YIM 78166]|uniref:hypothetical protein n=1 Tax=Ammoniphilus sp. YIM 78166 TaxID=1644106 RepID=UPI00106FC30F|nr:hypothetical protein [Ammoniphilus sp. YIM 78166]
MTRFSSDQEPNQKNQFLFSYDFKEEHDSGERFLYLTASVFDSTGSSSTEGKIVLPGKSSGRLASPLNSERMLGLNQPVTVLTVIEDDGNSMAYNEREILEYDESGQKPENMLQYDRVILFRVQLESET